MDRLFNMDNKFFTVMGRVADLIMLNVVFLICCLPIVTIGASLTALHYVTLKMARNEESYIIRSFFKSFKQNFKQSTLIWILMAAVAVFLYMEKESLVTMPGSMPQIFNYVILAVCIPLIAIALYIFPTVAAFENKTMTLITNAFYFAVKHIGYALAVAVITILPMTMTLVDAKFFPVYLLIWLMFGFSLTAYADSWFMWKLFSPTSKRRKRDITTWTQNLISTRFNRNR